MIYFNYIHECFPFFFRIDAIDCHQRVSKKRKLDETDDERPVQSTKKIEAGGSSSFVEATMNLATSSTKPNSQGTISSIDTTTLPNSEESRFPNDIGNFVDRPITEQQKYYILCNVWRPPHTYTFPMNEDKRRFRHEWLKIFPWLTYLLAWRFVWCRKYNYA